MSLPRASFASLLWVLASGCFLLDEWRPLDDDDTAANDDDTAANDDDATANDDDVTANDDDSGSDDDDDSTPDDDDSTPDDDDSAPDDDDSAPDDDDSAAPLPPTIDGIDGGGLPLAVDDVEGLATAVVDPNFATHRITEAWVVTGTSLDLVFGAELRDPTSLAVLYAQADGLDIAPGATAMQLTLTLPKTLVAGAYTLALLSTAGEASAETFVLQGEPAYSCWDSDESRTCDLGAEDANGDGSCSTLDCQVIAAADLLSLEQTIDAAVLTLQALEEEVTGVSDSLSGTRLDDLETAPAADISLVEIGEWDGAVVWGDHAGAGYATTLALSAAEGTLQGGIDDNTDDILSLQSTAIETDVVWTVGLSGDFETLEEAYDAARAVTFGGAGTLTIHLQSGSTHTVGEAILLDHPQGQHITILGDPDVPSAHVLNFPNWDGFVVSDGLNGGRIDGVQITGDCGTQLPVVGAYPRCNAVRVEGGARLILGGGEALYRENGLAGRVVIDGWGGGTAAGTVSEIEVTSGGTLDATGTEIASPTENTSWCVSASEGAYIDLDQASLDGCSYGVLATLNGHVNADNIVTTNTEIYALAAYHGGTLDAVAGASVGTFGAPEKCVHTEYGGHVTFGGECSANGERGAMHAGWGSTLFIDAATTIDNAAADGGGVRGELGAYINAANTEITVAGTDSNSAGAWSSQNGLVSVSGAVVSGTVECVYNWGGWLSTYVAEDALGSPLSCAVDSSTGGLHDP